MQSAPEDEDLADATEAGNEPEEAAEAAGPDATAKLVRRRTKTGCLTCRKRRIKCGEEKPVCRNCVKSKRECAGYAQPLVYKTQTPGVSSTDHASAQHFPSRPEVGTGSGAFSNPGAHVAQQYMGAHHNFNPAVPQQMQTLPFDASYHAFPSNVSHERGYMGPPPLISSEHYARQIVATGQPYITQFDPAGRPFATLAPQLAQQGTYHNLPVSLDPRLMAASVRAGSMPMPPQPQIYTPTYIHAAQESQDPRFFPGPSSTLPLSYNLSHGDLEEHATRQNDVPSFVHHAPFHTSVPAATNLAQPEFDNQPVYQDFDDPDDPFDVETNEQLSYQAAAENFTEILGQAGRRTGRPAPSHAPRRSQYHTPASFRPTASLSPLRDERNERIFIHFVEVTSRCMSVFERHHFTTMGGPARTLWNFTIPALAMSHPALAHAILALGGLHLAKLEGASEDTAIKHFTYAVRRVGKLLGLPRRRYDIATLAAVLLLGFYEVLSGDHSRWNLHLSGATELVLEHDYAGLTRSARHMRQGAKARVNQWMAQFTLTEENYARVAGIPLALLDDIDWEVDAAFISQLTGLRIDYDRQVQPNFSDPTVAMDLTEKDIEEFKAKMDLRWWYCKQDVFQSMVGGDPLLMPYENWIYCPPRGQLGRPTNPYATTDYLMLIMARLTDFGGKDRVRKQRAVAAGGGEWKPPKWLFGPRGPPMPKGPAARDDSKPAKASPQANDGKGAGPSTSESQNNPKASAAPSANEGRVRQSKPGLQAPTASKGGPPMFGMMPPPDGPIPVHSAFEKMAANINDPAFTGKRKGRKQTPPAQLEEASARAFAEHEDITKAFDLFSRSLGPDFDPLPATGAPITSPFGPVLIYRNAGIACIWAFYNVGRILLHRLHPEMHPAAMLSAGYTAHLTQDYAQTVGKICAGLYSTPHYAQSGALEPGFAGALMESTFSLLFAGVQFRDAAQRGWTVTKLQDISRRCGWQTAHAIAGACEMAWFRMGEAGRGPPYQRTLHSRRDDARMGGAPRIPTARKPAGQPVDPAAEHESEFVEHDRSLIDRSGSSRVHWALGLLSVEEDIQKMSLGEG